MRQFKAGLSPRRIKSASLADVDPFRSRQSCHHVRRNPHRRIGGTRCRNHLGIVFQGYVAKHRKGRRQSERTHAADGMAGNRNDFFRSEHARLGAEMIAEFTIVEPFRAGGNDEKNCVARLQADRFGNLVGIDAVRFGSQSDCRRTRFRFDNGHFGGILGEKRSDGFDGHAYLLGGMPRGFKVSRNSYAFYAMLRCDETSVF